MHLNVEIKAKTARSAEIEALLLTQNARYVGLDYQIDTYFNVSNGRLKLREGNIENHLIHYQRSNQEGPKQSIVTLYPSKPNSSLKAILEKSLGVLMVVDKQRKIFFIENVKFHIDEVEGLGSFVEIEAIDKDGTIGLDKLQKQCDVFMEYLSIRQEDLIAMSYSDLLRKE